MKFQPVPKPNFTQTPNVFFDDIAKTLKEGELRVLLVVMRQTFGWGNKEWDRISITQLMSKTGMERAAVVRATKSLTEKGIVTKHKTGSKGAEQSWYSLVVESPDDFLEESGNSNNSYQYPKDTPPPSILKIPTKEQSINSSLSHTNKDRDNREKKGAVSALPLSKKEPKKSVQQKSQESRLSREEREFHDVVVIYSPNGSEPIDSTFLIIQIKKYGLERVREAFDYVMSKTNKSGVKKSIGAYLRKALENGWKLPNESFHKNRRKCEDFCLENPGQFFMTQKYMTDHKSFEVRFEWPEERVDLLLEKKRFSLQ